MNNLVQTEIGSVKTILSIGLFLGAMSMFSSYSFATETPLHTNARIVDEQTSIERFQIQSTINLDGVTVTPISIAKNGETVAISIDGKTSKWTIDFNVKSKKSDAGVERVIMDLTVKKNGEIFSHPMLITDLNHAASIKQSHDLDKFEFTFEPRKID